MAYPSAIRAYDVRREKKTQEEGNLMKKRNKKKRERKRKKTHDVEYLYFVQSTPSSNIPDERSQWKIPKWKKKLFSFSSSIRQWRRRHFTLISMNSRNTGSDCRKTSYIVTGERAKKNVSLRSDGKREITFCEMVEQKSLLSFESIFSVLFGCAFSPSDSGRWCIVGINHVQKQVKRREQF